MIEDKVIKTNTDGKSEDKKRKRKTMLIKLKKIKDKKEEFSKSDIFMSYRIFSY